ncbi:MAG: hypothetical protein RBS17_06295 [Coriobacteriia bacterium]|nr:hypothetical protein [Coriobacteriia bacterium]
MRSEALFINGVFEGVLEEILQVQAQLPDQIMFLQPFAGSPMVELRDDPPTVEAPMTLFLSVTSDLPTVRYAAEIVGWDDKRELSPQKRNVLNRLLYCLQPGEGGLYDAARTDEGKSVNLLYIRRLRKLQTPFGVERLIKTSDGKPVSPNRSTSGGWSYVRLADGAA